MPSANHRAPYGPHDRPGRHIVLLGDSIFDNAAYVQGRPDVIAQLRALLPSDARATLLAVDGAVTASVHAQLHRLPADATDLVLSVGGNDALGHVHLLERPARDGAHVLDWFAQAVGSFRTEYRALLHAIAATGRPLTVCTIYEGRLAAGLQAPASAALGMFNDVIQRAATASHLPIIELRDVCTEPGDYANPIEPSVQGGARIAATILARLDGSGPDVRGRPGAHPSDARRGSA